jgi:peptide/nickel transport system substrate-binding protein
MKKAVVMFALVSTMILSITLPGLTVPVRAQSSDGWVLQWSYAYGGGGECQFAQPIGDIDKDGVNEIIVGGYEDIGRAHILSYNKSAGTYVEEYNWTYSVPGNYYTVPAGACVVDLDGDGNLEFVVAWSYSGPMGVYAYRWDGRTLTTLDVYTGAGTDDLFDVYACDYDNDGRVEVLLANGPNAAGGGYHVTALGWDNARNKFLAEAFWKLAGYDSTMECPMAWSGDTDNDGKTEVVACISGGDSATAGTWALNWNAATGQWQEVLVYNGLITGGTHYGVTVGDVDGDGTPEIGIGNNVAQYGAGACLFEWNDSTYRKVWEGSWPTEYPTIESVAIGDADNDGKQEFCVGGGHVHIIGWTGSNYTEEATITDTSGLLSGLNIGDCDTDGWNELKACDILGVGPGKQWIFKHPPQKRQIVNYKAVLVGMDYYTPYPPHHWYSNATAMRDTLLTWDCWKRGVIKLVGPNASMNEIIGNLSAMSVGPNDFFLFYYSGHGSYYNDANYEPPPAPNPAEELLYASKYPRALTDDSLTDCFRKFDPNAEKVAILDCCYAGGFWNGSDEGDLERVQGTALLASVPEDKQSPESSDFTNALVQGMNRTTGRAPADADGNGEVTVSEWFDYAEKTVPTGPIYGYRKDEEKPLPPEEQESFGNKTTMFNEPVAVGRLDLVISSPPVRRPYELISATAEGPETVDPCWAYDTASGELISNVYDTLLVFDGERPDTFIPRVATSYVIQNITGTTSPEGLPWYFRYTFAIRQGIKFHNESYTLTPRDVEYSIERQMVQDREGGPQWMLYEPLLNGEGANFINQHDMNLDDPETVVTVGKMIDHAVESNATYVWFNLAFPGAYTPFLQILCQPCSSIMCQQWIKHYVIGTLGRPDWNGEWGDYTGWIGHHNPSVSPLDDPTPLEMGSGPFTLESLDYTAKQWSATRFTDYWDGWPASFPKIGPAKPAGYVNHLVVTWAYDWETRLSMFLTGDVDFCTVPRQHNDAVLNKPGIRCVFPLPTLDCDALFFQFKIDPTTPYSPILPASTFAETGIPNDFFGNPTWGVHVRKAFAFALDYNTLIADAFQGEAIHPATAIIPGLAGYDATVKGFNYNLTAAIAQLQMVPSLWNTGFTITLVYNTGNALRQHCAELLKAAFEALNPKFHVTIASLEWQTYLRAMFHRQLPAFIYGWLAEYPDPHDFALPFYGSTGSLAALQGYSNPAMDALIQAGIRESDQAERTQIYHDISQLAIDDCPSTTLCQPIGRHFERDWVNGWYYNPLYPGIYAYNLWKWYYVPHAIVEQASSSMNKYLPTDVNYDGKVNIVDITIVAQAFGASYGPPIHPRWQFRADIDNNRLINIVDIAAVARYVGQTSAIWTPPP